MFCGPCLGALAPGGGVTEGVCTVPKWPLQTPTVTPASKVAEKNDSGGGKMRKRKRRRRRQIRTRRIRKEKKERREQEQKSRKGGGGGGEGGRK